MSPKECRRIAYNCHQMGYNILGSYWANQATEQENAMNQTRLCDAGIREQEWAQKLIAEKQLPADITYQDLLDHGVYDARTDEILFTIKGVCLKFKVERP